MKVSRVFLSATVLVLAQIAAATPCGDFIYNKNGKFRKYQYMNNTGIENTKKHGSSTTFQHSTEGSTASVDPGVSTGVSSSSMQTSSTYGECKWMGYYANYSEYKDYLAQNMHEIKNEMAKGQGGHLEVLASAFTCGEDGRKGLSSVLQKNFDKFVDLQPTQSAEFANSLKQVVEANPNLNCHAI